MSTTMQAMLNLHRRNGKVVVVLKDEWRGQLASGPHDSASEVMQQSVLDLGYGV
jgi:hypothetical protein